jgi:opacity protein-like surface antigen
MHLKLFLGLTLAAIFLGAAYPASAQTVPAATESTLPLAVGAGFSYFDPDWYTGQGQIYGGALWIDYIPNRVPWILRGLGVEIEARDVSLGQSSSEPSNLREDTAGGGLIYTWRHYPRFHPYVKGLGGYASIDFHGGPGYNHDSRTIVIAGAGAEYRVMKRVWVRGDYEYQFWPNFLPHNQAQPNGVTVGASYHFNTPHFRY